MSTALVPSCAKMCQTASFLFFESYFYNIILTLIILIATSDYKLYDNEISKEGRNSYKISFATVCMNRLHHIRQTLPKNIQDNSEYENVEFLLLDYNSTDGLEDWVKKNMKEHIRSGKLSFYRTTEPTYFKRSHSRNMILRMAIGDIVCNVDADNYTGKGFASFLNEEFNGDRNIFLSGSYSDEFIDYKDAYGRFCGWRDDFLKVGGYDEEMESYGHEDTDLYDRLVRYGRKEKKIKETKFLHSISHSDRERTGNEFFRLNLERFYLAYLDTKKSVLFLYKNGSFEMGTLVENYYSIPSPSAIEEKGWIKGCWVESGNSLWLYKEDNSCYELQTDNNCLNYMIKCDSGLLIYSCITNASLLHNMMQNYSIITNSNRMHLNEIKNKIIVNDHLKKMGDGSVYKNFNIHNEIAIQ